MSIAFARVSTESATVLHSRNFSYDSIYQHYGVGQDIDGGTEPDQIPFTCDQSSRSDEQFHCTDSSLLERTDFDSNESDSSSIVSSKILQEGEEEKTNHQYGSSYSKQAAEVAAAARFISTVDVIVFQTRLEVSPLVFPKSRLGSAASIRDSILNNSSTISKTKTKTKTIRMRPHSPKVRSKSSKPPPLQLVQGQPGSEEIHTPLPTRISSKGAPSFDLVRPVDAGKQVSHNNLSPGLDGGQKILPSVLTPESASTFQFDFVLPIESGPTEPQLSRSESGATTDSQSPSTPPNGLIGDHVRQDIETFAAEQKSHLGGSSRRMRQLPGVDVSKDRRLVDVPPPVLPKNDETQATVALEDGKNMSPTLLEHPDAGAQTLRRKKSMFGWLQKKSEVEVDELIDLYMSDEQREVKNVRRKPSKAKLAVFRTRTMTDTLPTKPG